VATSFLILDPDGRVHREYRIPKRSRRHLPTANSRAGTNGDVEKPKPPSSDDLSDRQLAVTFTHQAGADLLPFVPRDWNHRVPTQ
jgi:hypothetical protein